MLGGGLERDLGVGCGILCDFEVLGCDGAVGIQVRGSIQLLSREKLIGNSLAVSVEASGHIVTANGQQQLTFFDGVAESRMNGNDAPGGKGDNRDIASNIRSR